MKRTAILYTASHMFFGRIHAHILIVSFYLANASFYLAYLERYLTRTMFKRPNWYFTTPLIKADLPPLLHRSISATATAFTGDRRCCHITAAPDCTPVRDGHFFE